MAKLGHEDDEDTNATATVDDPNDDTDPSQQEQIEDETVPRVVVEDERLNADENNDSGEDEEDEPPAEQNQRRRESAKERRERIKAAKERDKQEIELLRNTVAKQDQRFREIEQNLIVNRITALDKDLSTAIAEAEQFDKIFGAAITAKNGEDARKAEQLRDEAKQRAWDLHNQREQLVQAAKAPPPAAPVPYAQHAINFLKDKPWYNPKAGDEDSLVVEALDRALSKTMNPNDPSYWQTLDRKVKERLPHRYGRQDNTREDDDVSDDEPEERPTQRRKGPPTGGTNRSSGSGNRGPQEIRLPAEMVEAMKEAGYWDDPKVRARVAQRYINGVKNRNG